MRNFFKRMFAREDFDLLGAESSVQSLPLFQQIIAGTHYMWNLFRINSRDLRAPWSISYRHNKSKQPSSLILQTHMQASEKSRGFTNTAKLLYKHGCIRRFYRGAIPIVMGCIPAHAAFFGTYEFAKIKFKIEDGVRAN